MIGSWLKGLRRKFLRKKDLLKQGCPMRRWRVRPSLEPLEVRALLATSWLPLPVHLPMPAASAPSDPGAGTAASTSAVNYSVTGLDQLLQDLRFVPPPAQITPLDTISAVSAVSTLDGSVSEPVPRPHGIAQVASNPGDSIPPASPDPVAASVASVASSSHAATAPLDRAAGNAANEPSPELAQASVTLPQPANTPVPGATTFSAAPNTLTIEEFAASWLPPAASASSDSVTTEPGSNDSAWLDAEIFAAPTLTPESTASAFADMQDVGLATSTATLPFDASTAAAPPAGCADPAATSPDGALLERFVVGQDQAAFTSLVARHQRLIFSICQRVLGDAQIAEDAVQATFMILARKAQALDRQRPLTGWLCLVAYHLALRLRAVTARRRRCELQAAGSRSAHAADLGEPGLEQEETHQLLREELQQLPEKYRMPLVLCYFQGQTHAQAARTIGLPRGSIAKRIDAALQQLRQRLVERGVSL